MAERRIDTAIEINAPVARVWALLTDFAGMPAWNPFITAISGSAAEGARLSVRIAPPGRAAMRFNHRVLRVRPERELRWVGRLLVPGIFDGEHYFMLEPLGDGHTRLRHGEHFSGLLVGLLPGALTATEMGFRAMNSAVKRQAEKGARIEATPALDGVSAA